MSEKVADLDAYRLEKRGVVSPLAMRRTITELGVAPDDFDRLLQDDSPEGEGRLRWVHEQATTIRDSLVLCAIMSVSSRYEEVLQEFNTLNASLPGAGISVIEAAYGTYEDQHIVDEALRQLTTEVEGWVKG